MVSLAECVAWLALGLMLSVAIIVLNLITVICFIKNRKLRKRSTYLMINLAIIDMLAGGSAINGLFIGNGRYCNLWKYSFSDNRLLWLTYYTINLLFPVSSVTNITAISLERLHATFWPLKHRVAQKWIFGLIVAIIWVIAGLVSTADVVSTELKQSSHYYYLWNSFNSICLLIICVCYSSIVIKVRCGAQPQHHGAASRETKLTMTLFVVTIVSLLLWLPFVISSFLYFETDIFSSLSSIATRRLNFALIILFYANSLVNPILYTARMPDFRRALTALFRRRPQQLNQAPVIPLRDM